MKIINNLAKIFVILFCLSSCSKKKTAVLNYVEEPKESTEIMKLLIGTYTNKTSEGIYTLDFNINDGTLSNKLLVAKSESPSFLAKSTDGNYVYAVNENSNGEVSSFRWNADRTKLIAINKLSTQGVHPCFLELNKTNNQLAVANYSSGNAAVFNINLDGSLMENPQFRQHEGSGSSLPNQESAHAHCTKFSNDNLLYVVDLGIDEVASYTVDENGELGKKETALKTDVSDGPRHLIFHPTKEVSYVINEISNSIIVSTINQADGSFNRIQKISTLPGDFKGESHCADIHITSNGKFLYASNRGHNSIAMYSVADNGLLTFLGTESVRGNWPRNFALSKDEKFLLVANQNSGNIVVFKVEDKTGLLAFTGTDFELSKPVCLKF